MSIEFSCPSCHLPYRVKDELAGKGAKCKCGHRIKIPERAAPKGVSAPLPSQVTAANRPTKASPTASPGSWLDEELEASQSAIVAAPRAAQPTCPACSVPLAAGAVLCVACGYDTRSRGKHETKHVFGSPASDAEEPRRRTKLRSAATLLRGTLFSFIAAILGAIIWALLAYATQREFGIVAWAMGGLVGFGMALGHDDDDGTFAGIIAAFMSLFGIVAAKILIIVIVVAGAVAAAVGQIDIDANANPVEAQRESVAEALASDQMEQDGVDMVEATDEQWEAAMEKARAEVANLSEEELEQKAAQLDAEAEEEAAAEDVAEEQQGALGAEVAAAPAPAVAEEGPGMIGLFFSMMFSPIDGLFVLLAFFTAYKVGSGQATD